MNEFKGKLRQVKNWKTAAFTKAETSNAVFLNPESADSFESAKGSG